MLSEKLVFQHLERMVGANPVGTKPLLEGVAFSTELVIGPRAKKPLKLKTPLFVSDMSSGALSVEAKLSLSKGAAD